MIKYLSVPRVTFTVTVRGHTYVLSAFDLKGPDIKTQIYLYLDFAQLFLFLIFFTRKVYVYEQWIIHRSIDVMKRIPHVATLNVKITLIESKIEKVPRGIRGEKSSKDMASSRNLVSTIGALASPKKWGTEPGVRKGKRSLLACHTRCNISIETTRNSVKVKVGFKVMKLVKKV